MRKRSNKIKFANYSMMVGKKYDRDWWEWCVFVNDDKSIIKRILQVEYTLHPTFPDPIRTVTNKLERFALYSSGWGQFTVQIEVRLDDNTYSRQSHMVRFEEDNWPKKDEPTHFDSEAESEVYFSIKDDQFRWRKINTIAKNTNLSPEKVIEILHELEKKELVRKSPFTSIDKNEMWGLTAIVGCYPPRIISE